MQNIIHLLALIRIGGNPEAASRTIDAFARWVAQHQGYLIDAAPPQLLVCLPDAGLALEALHALMNEGDRHGFTVSAGLVQAIRATDHMPRSPNDFTERTLETVLELAGQAGPQEVTASPKLMSLLQLAVPDYAAWFEPAHTDPSRPVTRVRQMQVMRGRRLPRYVGDVAVLDAGGAAG